MTEGEVAVGGVRLAAKPLHWGHYVGTFAALRETAQDKSLFYVIKDTEPLLWRSAADKARAVEDIAQSAIAISEGIEVRPVLASVLLRNAWPITAILSDIVTHSSLVTAHFKKAEIRSGSFRGSVRNFLWPLDEAVVWTFMKAARFYSNTDNLRIVRFARDIQRRFGAKLAQADRCVLTELVHYPGLPYLPGPDYARMCTAGGNVLEVFAEYDRQVEFSRTASSLRAYFRQRPDRLAAWKAGGRSGILQEDFLPSILLRVLGQRVAAEQILAAEAPEAAREMSIELLVRGFNECVKRWRSRLEEDETKSWSYERVHQVSQESASAFAEVWRAVLDQAWR